MSEINFQNEIGKNVTKTRPFHVILLDQELQARKQRNPKYSLRAFSHHMGMDPAAMSRILAGKQELSLRSAPKVAAALKLGAQEHEKFLASVVESLKARASAFLSATQPAQGVRLSLVYPTDLRPNQPSESDVEVIRVDSERAEEACRLIRSFARNLEQQLNSSRPMARPTELQLKFG